jgi:hypothetical protein
MGHSIAIMARWLDRDHGFSMLIRRLSTPLAATSCVASLRSSQRVLVCPQFRYSCRRRNSAPTGLLLIQQVSL